MNEKKIIGKNTGNCRT